MTEIISKRLRNMFMDHLSGWSVLREIENEFDAEYIPYKTVEGQAVGGQRRTLVQGYYNGLNFSDPKDVRKFLNVLSVFLSNLSRQIPDHPWSESDGSHPAKIELSKFEEQLRRDGYAFIDGTISPISAATRLSDAKAIAVTFNAVHIHEQIQRIEASVDTDPALAIGTAKELVESCFKTILKERGEEFGKNDDLLQLGKKCLKILDLVPDDVPDAAKGSATIKRVLNNLATIVQGIAELRSYYGSGHGKEGRSKGLSPRHARLAVGAASSLVTFLFDTHIEQKK